MRDEVVRWITQARADLKTARDNFRLQNYYVVALFCQQTIEKGLKALYIHKRRAVAPKTHSLPRLAREVHLPKRFQATIDHLNPAYVFARYPDVAEDAPVNLYTKPSVTDMLDETEVLFQWIQQQLED